MQNPRTPGAGVTGAANHALASDVRSLTTTGLPTQDRHARLVQWTPWHGSSNLLGHATISFSGWIVARIPIFRSRDAGLSVGVPTAAELDRAGTQKRDAEGKRQYSDVIAFEDPDARARWCKAVLAALSAAGIGHQPGGGAP